MCASIMVDPQSARDNLASLRLKLEDVAFSGSKIVDDPEWDRWRDERLVTLDDALRLLEQFQERQAKVYGASAKSLMHAERTLASWKNLDDILEARRTIREVAEGMRGAE